MNRSRGAIGTFLLSAVLSACAPAAVPSPSPSTPAPTATASALPTPTPAITRPPSTETPRPSPTPASPTVAEIALLRSRLAADPNDGAALRDLGLALLQRVRETADPSLYGQAGAAFDKAKGLRPTDALVLVGIGGLQLARHQFADALETAHAALALKPSLRPAKAIEVDALVELGRYPDAEKAAEELVVRGVDLSSLARVSYLREIHGNLPGALSAMEQAAQAPALAPENTAFVTTIEGNLLVLSGRPDDARAAYEKALAVVPDHAPALAGLGRLAVAGGDLQAAIAKFERASEIVPLPEYVIALGETREVAGDADGAKQSYDLARLETQLFESNGVEVDLELSLFEADHGDPTEALRLAAQAYATRQTFRTADAFAWASHRAGRAADAQRLSDEARRLGTHDPLLLYHAGMIASAAGDHDAARRLLTDALALDAGFSATGARAARAELARIAASS